MRQQQQQDTSASPIQMSSAAQRAASPTTRSGRTIKPINRFGYEKFGARTTKELNRGFGICLADFVSG